MSQTTSKWAKDYILIISDDGSETLTEAERLTYKSDITTSAIQYAVFKGIPLQRRFSNELWASRYIDNMKAEAAKVMGTANQLDLFTKLEKTSLKPLTASDKLFIFAHASNKLVGPQKPGALANILQWSGLQRVGLITFKACHVGSGTYLERFLQELATRAILVGFVKGYKGTAHTNVDDKWTEARTITEDIKDRKGKIKKGDDRLTILPGPLAQEEQEKATLNRYISFGQARAAAK